MESTCNIYDDTQVTIITSGKEDTSSLKDSDNMRETRYKALKEAGNQRSLGKTNTNGVKPNPMNGVNKSHSKDQFLDVLTSMRTDRPQN